MAAGGIIEVVPNCASRDEVRHNRGCGCGWRQGGGDRAERPAHVALSTPDTHIHTLQIGKQKFANLYEYFQHKFGREDGQKFEAARRNLVRSLAAYAVVCFILQVRPCLPPSYLCAHCVY